MAEETKHEEQPSSGGRYIRSESGELKKEEEEKPKPQEEKPQAEQPENKGDI